MKFKIHAIKDNIEKIFYYDNMKNILSDEFGYIYGVNPNEKKENTRSEFISFSPENPLKKSNVVTTLKIQLGLSCNYSCEYCSQRFVERAEETNFNDVEDFIKKLEHLKFDEKLGLRIELWGGEPLVYWKTLKPLVEALKFKFAYWLNKPRYSIITNGSIITEEIMEWLLDNMSSMAISHDGPGQSVRGPDPFDDPVQKERILRLYKTVKSGTRHCKGMSFNSMINAKNQSRNKIRQWFIDLTGDTNIILGEGGFVDAYDEGGIEMSLLSKEGHFEYRRNSFKEIYEVPSGENIGWSILIEKLNRFYNDLIEHAEAKHVGQKCGMDDFNTIAVDLRGDVITCQNVSIASINNNGQPHKSGNISDIDNVSITTSTHWSNRKECPSCPVLHICRGSCMFVSGEYWYHSCNNAYSDALSVFAVIFEKITGYIPVYIDNENLPDMRKDIFGTILDHPEEKISYTKGKKPFPVAVVAA